MVRIELVARPLAEVLLGVINDDVVQAVFSTDLVRRQLQFTQLNLVRIHQQLPDM